MTAQTRATDLGVTADRIAAQAATTFEPMALALQCGRLVATVVSKATGTHLTVQFRCKAKRADRWQPVAFSDATHVFIDVPRSGDRDAPNDRVGTYHPATGRLYAADGADPARLWAARFALWEAAGTPRANAGQAEVLAGVRCLCCGRELTDPVSIRRNIGPDCWERATGMAGATGSAHQQKTAPEAAPAAPETTSGPRTPEPPRSPETAASGPQDGSGGRFRLGAGRSALDAMRDLEGATR